MSLCSIETYFHFMFCRRNDDKVVMWCSSVLTPTWPFQTQTTFWQILREPAIVCMCEQIKVSLSKTNGWPQLPLIFLVIASCLWENVLSQKVKLIAVPGKWLPHYSALHPVILFSLILQSLPTYAKCSNYIAKLLLTIPGFSESLLSLSFVEV